MAITNKYKKKLLQLLESKINWYAPDLVTALGVAPNWVSRNKTELEELGFRITRKGREDSGKSRLKPKLFSEIISETPLTDLFYYNNLFLKYYINKAYVYYGLVAPFQLEAITFRSSTITSDILDALDDRVEKESFNYLEYLRLIVEERNPDSELHSAKYPVNITVYLKTLYDSIHLLGTIQVSEDLNLIINNTFKDIFNLVPTNEQIQVVAKALKYASSIEDTYNSVSVQSDARI